MTGKDGKSADCQMPIIWGCAEESSVFASSCGSRRKRRLQILLLSNISLRMFILIHDCSRCCRFLGGIKQYLCLSLLKNSALSAMNVFQLLCSIFMILLSRFRSELKGEIGIFFPMLVLRVLENVLQPSFSQKLIVLNLLENMCDDSQVMIDIFVNYDCDVDAPNIFERYTIHIIFCSLFSIIVFPN